MGHTTLLKYVSSKNKTPGSQRRMLIIINYHYFQDIKSKTFGDAIHAINISIFVNPLPHIKAFQRLCSRQLFENMATKEEIAQNEQFLLLKPVFQLYSMVLFIEVFHIFAQSSAADLLYVGKDPSQII